MGIIITEDSQNLNLIMKNIVQTFGKKVSINEYKKYSLKRFTNNFKRKNQSQLLLSKAQDMEL